MSADRQGSGAGAASKRRAAERLGGRAEALCRLALRLKGYRILARRFRCHGGEIDIVARRGGIVAFVEVKARADLADGLAAVTPRQRRRVETAAAAFLATRPAGGEAQIRFDVMVARPWRWPVHLADAWRPGW